MADIDPEKSTGNEEQRRRAWTEEIARSAPQEMETLFLRAIGSRDRLGLDLLLEADREFFTPDLKRGLILAAEKGHADIIRRLLKSGAEVDAYAGLPLRLAVSHGHRDAAWELVKAGANLKRPMSNLLSEAAAAGHVDMMSWLWDHGVRNNTPYVIYRAAEAGRTEAVDFILARMDKKNDDRLLFASTMTALERGHDAIARRLIGAGFHRLGNEAAMLETICTKHDADLATFFLDRTQLEQSVLDRNLDRAVEKRDTAMVVALLNAGAEPLDKTYPPDIRALLDDVGAQSPATAAGTFSTLFGQAATPAALAKTDSRGTNGYLLAALAGKWDAVEEAMIRRPDEAVRASDLTARNRLGRNAIETLGKTKRLKTFFNDAVWKGRPLTEQIETLNAVPRAFHTEIGHERIMNTLRQRQLDAFSGRRRRFSGPPA